MATERCDCGAEYPSGADYCPNCGRPLTEEALAEDRARNAFVRETEPEEEKPPPISFGNPQALRACYWPAALATFLVSLPLFSMLCWVWYPAAGFAAVAGYRKRTGASVEVSEGGKLGWIAGIMAFTLTLILGALASLFGEGFGAGLERMQTELRENGEAEMADAIANLAGDPVTLVTAAVISLALMFVFITAMTTLGGALGARVLRDD